MGVRGLDEPTFVMVDVTNLSATYATMSALVVVQKQSLNYTQKRQYEPNRPSDIQELLFSLSTLVESDGGLNFFTSVTSF